MYSDSLSEDFSLRFFDNCESYLTKVLENNISYYDSNMYLSNYGPQILQKVNKKVRKK